MAIRIRTQRADVRGLSTFTTSVARGAELVRRAPSALPSRRRRGAPSDLVVALALVIVAAAAAWSEPSIVRIAGAVALLAMVFALTTDGDSGLGRGRTYAAVGVVVLTVTDAGVLAAGESMVLGELWRPLLAVGAYPLLGRALLLMILRYRQVRSADVVVEAALIGAAFAITLQLVVQHLWAPAGVDTVPIAVSSLLAGLDVALLVLVARSVTTEAARRLSVGILTGAIGALLVGHVAATVAAGRGQSPALTVAIATAVALLALGAGSVHDARTDRPGVIPVEAPLFSASHAGIVVIAVFASPAVLAAQVFWGVPSSGAVALGAGLIGTVLALHTVKLLQERAGQEHQATHDALTDLPNRLLYLDRLERALAHAIRSDAPVGVLYIDLDRFKEVNDTFGHDAGDQLLQETARRLAGCARHEDTVARLGGDEFAVLLPHLRAADDIAIVANRILEALRQPVVLGDHAVLSLGSVGAAVFPNDGTTPAELLSAADAAMYRAKDQGGSAVEVYSAELRAQAASRLELETALHRAIGAGELVLHYQPIVEAADGRTAGAEALVRWIHPERGMVPPGEFIPVAEQSELIVEVGDWVIVAACRELAAWSRAGLGDRFITINVSPRHFREDLARSIATALRDTGADPSRLIVELTETAAVEDIALVTERLHELRRLGVTAAIDDFGTGYSSLQYLGDLPVSTVKIDRSFVQAMTPSAEAIVAGTIAMARTLGLTTVAEGIETDEQRRLLQHHGCDRLQGYHLGKPMPADAFVARALEEDQRFADARARGRAPLRAVPPAPTPTAADAAAPDLPATSTGP